MTEPPEPRHPEEGGGEEDYDAAWDNADADEIMGGLEDDALLDSIAQSLRGELGPDELTELLAGLRDVPDAVDIPVPNTARVERGENVLPPRTQEGNTEPMSTQESIAALNTVADSGAAAGPLAEAKSTLEATVAPGLMHAVEQLAELRSAAVAATEGTAVSSGEVGSAGEHAANAIEDALDLVQQAAAGVEQATQHVAAFHSAARSAAERLAGS